MRYQDRPHDYQVRISQESASSGTVDQGQVQR